ncbi:hypothetical protein HDU81_006057 [Chytriomyces hyalinus]|nr:hypothetical protein HDU81_006057 [Chytriomyces hyalinus]
MQSPMSLTNEFLCSPQFAQESFDALLLSSQEALAATSGIQSPPFESLAPLVTSFPMTPVQEMMPAAGQLFINQFMFPPIIPSQPVPTFKFEVSDLMQPANQSFSELHSPPASANVDYFQYSATFDNHFLLAQPAVQQAVQMSAPVSPAPQSPVSPQPEVSETKQKKMRFRATEAELTFLLSYFESNPFPSSKDRTRLASKLGLEPRQILFWFQNRRATLKSNGVLAVKPKRNNLTSSLAFKGKQNNLAPLSAGNPYFYVAERKENI